MNKSLGDLMRFRRFKLLNLDFKIPEGYESSDDRVILVESENGEFSEISLDERGREPTIKLANGKVFSKGSAARISLDDTAKSISTTVKYCESSNEFTFLVRKFVDKKQVCRALKSEVDKYTNVIINPKTDGYEAKTNDGKHVLCYVQEQCLVVITTNDPANIDSVFEIKTNTSGWALAQLIFGIVLILFDIFAFIILGLDYRILFLLALSLYFVNNGYSGTKTKKNNCPKFEIN